MGRRHLGVMAATAMLAGLAGCTGDAGQQPTTSPSAVGSSGGVVSTQVGAAAVPAPAPWWNDEVFYEVFVRSFSDSNGDGSGDLRGLINRLDYLEDLGVTALWLMPITQSPSYHGYDTTDYLTVEEDYGSNEDFKELVAERPRARHRGHRGPDAQPHVEQHPWFRDSASGPESPKRDWYVWSADDPGTIDRPGGLRRGTPRTPRYYLGLFWEGMPDLNYANPAVTRQMYDVARFWLEDMGVDGFRLDAVRHLIEDGDQLEGTPQTHAGCRAWDDHLDSVEPESLTVGEVWDETSVGAPYVNGRRGRPCVRVLAGRGDHRQRHVPRPVPLTERLGTVLAAYPPGQFAPFLTNHDQNRVMSQLGGGGARTGDGEAGSQRAAHAAGGAFRLLRRGDRHARREARRADPHAHAMGLLGERRVHLRDPLGAGQR